MKIALSFDRRIRLLILMGLLQGSLLFWMHKLLQYHVWPATEPVWVVTWYTLALSIPLALQLMVDHLSGSKAWRFAAGLAALLFALSVYTGRAIFPEKGMEPFEICGYFGLTVSILWYVSLPFAQTWLKTGRARFPYPDLFDYSWNNILTIETAGVFAALFWGSLELWAGMFHILKIDFFKDLFHRTSFIYLVTGSVFGFALSFGRSQKGLVTNLRATVLTIFRNLLPLPAFIGLIFLAALPFTGLKPLWDTGHATLLMLNLQIYVILFLNAVYQDGGEEPPYHPLIRRLVEVGVIVLPAYALLCAHATQLRIGQYGWSVNRVFGAVAVFVTGLYAAGYSWAALKRGSPWMRIISPVNVRIAVIVMALAVLLNTPVMDARLITVRSQTTRLMKGKISAEKFDYDYVRFSLGKPGRDALVQLSKLQGHPKAEQIRSRASAALAKKSRWAGPAGAQTVEEVARQAKIYPQGKTLDPTFLPFLLANKRKYGQYLTDDLRVLVLDLNGDDKEECVLLGGYFPPKRVFSLSAEGWKEIGSLTAVGNSGITDDELDKNLKTGDYRVIPPKWNLLQLGKKTFHLFEKTEGEGGNGPFIE